MLAPDSLGSAILPSKSPHQLELRLVNGTSFISGDEIVGVLRLSVGGDSCFHVKNASVVLSGVESVNWEEMQIDFKDQSIVPKRNYRTMLHQTLSFIEGGGPGSIANGTFHEFGFRFVLPDVLPSSFFHLGTYNNKHYSASIVYTLDARVEDKDSECDIRDMVCIVVNERMVNEPSYTISRKKLSSPPGGLNIRCWLDRNLYSPGETVLLKLEANSTFGKPTNAVCVSVVRTLRLNEVVKVRSIISHEKYRGFSRYFFGERYLSWSIPVRMQAVSTNGVLIHCSYAVIVECCIDNDNDNMSSVKASLPLYITASSRLFHDEAILQPTPPTLPPDVQFRPPWQIDSDTDVCSLCGTEFGFVFNRRHHCRHCCMCVCGHCSQPHRSRLSQLGWGNDYMRVCDGCVVFAHDNGVCFQQTATPHFSRRVSISSHLKIEEPINGEKTVGACATTDIDNTMNNSPSLSNGIGCTGKSDPVTQGDDEEWEDTDDDDDPEL